MSVIRNFGEVFAPRFFIEADGALANDLIPFITKFEYEDDEAKSDKLTLQVANPGLRFKDDSRFRQGVRFRVRFGYLTDISDVKVAVIAHARPTFAGPMPTIEMVALNLQQDMNKKANPQNWGTISSSDVARQIAAKYGFKVEIEESNDSRRQARVQPAGVTDIQFLQGLANKLNWDCFIDYSTLHFHKKRYDLPAACEFTYFTDATGTLIKFQPDVNMTSPPAVKTAGTDNKDAHTEAGGREEKPTRAVDFGNERTSKLIPNNSGPSAHRGESGLVGPSHETDPRVIAKHGEAIAQAVDMNAIKATAEMIGTPRVRARQMIRISGVDQLYSGNWRVSKSKHIIEPKGVYRVQANLKRDAGNANSKEQNKHGSEGAEGGKEKRVAVDLNKLRTSGTFSQ